MLSTCFDFKSKNFFQHFFLPLPLLTCLLAREEGEGVVEVGGGEVDRRLEQDMLHPPMSATLRLLSMAPASQSMEMQVMQCPPMQLETIP